MWVCIRQGADLRGLRVSEGIAAGAWARRRTLGKAGKMAIIRCSCGFFYDDEKYGTCPKCSGAYRAARPVESVLEVSGAPGSGRMGRRLDGEKAQAFFRTGEQGLFAGWLVCVKGGQKGQDFRLFPGFNRVGRRAQSDVCLEDLRVARENHCAVVYEPKRGEFFLTPGMGTETYLNGTRLEGTKMLENGDEIGLGDSLLVFVPFCGKERTWEKW